jgi:hypothetical protein
VSFGRLIQRCLRVVLAGFVIAFGAMLRRRPMAFGDVLVFLRSGSVRLNCVGFGIHEKAPYFLRLLYTIATASLYGTHCQNNVKNESSHDLLPPVRKVLPQVIGSRDGEGVDLRTVKPATNKQFGVPRSACPWLPAGRCWSGVNPVGCYGGLLNGLIRALYLY